MYPHKLNRKIIFKRKGLCKMCGKHLTLPTATYCSSSCYRKSIKKKYTILGELITVPPPVMNGDGT